MRYTTLSRRDSSNWIRVSPVLPRRRSASTKYLWNCFSRTPYMRLSFCFSRNCRPKSEVRAPEVRPCWPGLDSSLHLESSSEEHTSELQSLLRISYAVFCLKNKTNTKTNTQILH